MDLIEIDYDGKILVGQIISRDKWDFSVKLIKPYMSWVGGCHIASFARSDINNYEGFKGDVAIKNTLIDLYKKANKFYSGEERFKRIYLDYVDEMYAISGIEIKVRERIKTKLDDWILNTILGHGSWNVDDRDGILKILNQNLLN